MKYGDLSLPSFLSGVPLPKLRTLDFHIRTKSDHRDAEWVDSLLPTLLDRFPSLDSCKFSFPSLAIFRVFEQIAKLRSFHIHCLEKTTCKELEEKLVAIFSQETHNLEVLRITCNDGFIELPTDPMYWSSRLDKRLPSSLQAVLF